MCGSVVWGRVWWGRRQVVKGQARCVRGGIRVQGVRGWGVQQQAVGGVDCALRRSSLKGSLLTQCNPGHAGQGGTQAEWHAATNWNSPHAVPSIHYQRAAVVVWVNRAPSCYSGQVWEAGVGGGACRAAAWGVWWAGAGARWHPHANALPVLVGTPRDDTPCTGSNVE